MSENLTPPENVISRDDLQDKVLEALSNDGWPYPSELTEEELREAVINHDSITYYEPNSLSWSDMVEKADLKGWVEDLAGGTSVYILTDEHMRGLRQGYNLHNDVYVDLYGAEDRIYEALVSGYSIAIDFEDEIDMREVWERAYDDIRDAKEQEYYSDLEDEYDEVVDEY